MRPPETEGLIDIEINGYGRNVSATVNGSITTRLKNIGDTLGLSKRQVMRAMDRIDRNNDYTGFFYAHMTKTLTPISNRARIVSVKPEPLIVTSRKYRNDSSTRATYSGKLSHTDTNSVELSWSNTEQEETAFEIGFNVKLTGSARMSFTNCYGNSGGKSTSVTLSSEDSVTVDLMPGQCKIASLKANRNLVTLEIDFNVTYDGNVVGNQTDYSNNTFALEEILDELNKSNSHRVTETIRLSYFTDSEVVLRDA